jgi:hypothetical protein
MESMMSKCPQQLDLTLAKVTSQQSRVDPLLRTEIVTLLKILISECVFAPETSSREEQSDDQ